MTDDASLLRTGLLANAAFSVATGLLLTIAPGTVAGWLAVEIDGWLRLLGLALLGHGLLLTVGARRPHPEALGKLNLTLIAPYPLLMIGLAATTLVDRTIGKVLVLTDGAVVGSIALNQAAGLRRLSAST